MLIGPANFGGGIFTLGSGDGISIYGCVASVTCEAVTAVATCGVAVGAAIHVAVGVTVGAGSAAT
jgi:hypothetical protein